MLNILLNFDTFYTGDLVFNIIIIYYVHNNDVVQTSIINVYQITIIIIC